MTFTIKVWYAATADDEPPQVHPDLTGEQALQGAQAFLRDLVHLEGRGVRRITVESQREGA
jgi:hypothetical protein